MATISARWSATILRPGESADTPRVLAAAGHAGAVLFHWAVEHDRLDLVPDGAAWARAYDAIPPRTRHLTLHDGHLSDVNAVDRPFVRGDLLVRAGAALDAHGWRAKISQLQAGGATEVAYQPAGPDIPGELEAFAALMAGAA